jgi:hypothetical protein
VTADHLAVNLAHWNERAPAHAASPGYAVDRFVTDPRFLSDVVRGEAMLGAAESDVRRQLDDARALLDTGEGRDADELGREYGPKLLELQAGLCLTEAGRPAEAVPVYDAVIADGATSERDRAYFRILQATSLALAGEPDRAAEQGRAALPVAVAAGSLRSVAEARTLLGVLAPWRQRTPVREFAAAVRETSGGGSVR